MTAVKIRRCWDSDRLSNLPDSIIRHILSFLPPKDAAITRILSTTFLRLWYDSPNFYFHSENPSQRHQLRSLIRTTFRRRRRLNASLDIRSFRLYAPSISRLSSLIRYASLYFNLQVLDLCLPKKEDFSSCLDILFTGFPSLQSLKLEVGATDGSYLLSLPQNPEEINLRNLRTLHLHRFLFPDDVLPRLLSACLDLEELALPSFRLSRSGGILDITASNLKRLSVNCSYLDLSENELCISCPRLELFELTLSYSFLLSHVRGDMPSLSKAVILLGCISSTSAKLVDQILHSVSNVIELSFLSTTFMTRLAPTCTFHNLRSLHLDACLHDGNIEAVVCFLELASNLNFLRISLKIGCNCSWRGVNVWRARELHNPYFLHCLKEVVLDDIVREIRDGADFLEIPCINVKEFILFLSVNVRGWERVEKKYEKFAQKCTPMSSVDWGSDSVGLYLLDGVID